MQTDGQKWLVDGFIAEGDVNLIVGQPSRGMSWAPWHLWLDLAGTPLTHRCSGRAAVMELLAQRKAAEKQQ